MPFNLDGPKTYAAKDKKYTTSAMTATIKRFGPSESLKNKNSALEQMMAAIASTVNENAFDLKYKFSVSLTMSI
ncbi:MAG: hypothetical protein JST50_03455 [Bacteroidetes bacterium]|jgi:hypothetical protein|nr:hypothetical protein [Bacteroidota bacterium]